MLNSAQMLRAIFALSLSFLVTVNIVSANYADGWSGAGARPIYRTNLLQGQPGNFTDCGDGLFVDEGGEILSPNYPEDYPPNADCQWVIYVEFGKKIQLHFEEFSLDWNSDCRAEYLEIQDFDSAALHCGSATPPDVVSQGNSVLIIFKSDDVTNGPGDTEVRRFKIKFSVDGGGGNEGFCNTLPSNPCLNGGVCVDKPDSTGFTCDCLEGFSGDLCQCEENPCESVDCGLGGVCIEVDGCSSIMCICDDGFVASSNGTCVDLNECLQFNPCHPLATCTNLPGSFECACNDGFIGDGVESCVPEEPDVCPGNWTTYPGSSSCYRVTETVHPGAGMQQACEFLHHLASPVCIQSEEEMNFVSTLVPNAEVEGDFTSAGSWIGISENANQCLSGESALSPTPWFPGQPDDGAGAACIYARPHKIATRPCDGKPLTNNTSATSRLDFYFGLCETTRMCWNVTICPPGFKAIGTSCYAALHKATTFNEARLACQNLDVEADLASLTNEDELLTVMESGVIGAGGPYWVGLVYIESQKEYQWVDGSGPVTFDAWIDSSEPSIQATAGCGVVAKSHWGDSVCDVEYNVICEVPKP